MAKNTRGAKEFTREQRLSKENKQLKRELSHLRKQIAKLDGDSFETLKQMSAEDEEQFQGFVKDANSITEDLKKAWACKECFVGVLEISLYTKLNQTFYFRKCNNCFKRTKGQRYDSESVKGIIKQ
jgi:ferritin-like metal-binding protein YciE